MTSKHNVVFGTDALGRRLPNAADFSVPAKERYVGMFYFHQKQMTERLEQHNNISEIMRTMPGAAWHPEWEAWKGNALFWGEPLYGYYKSSDEWVARKHAELLTLAGVDFIFLDCTNGVYFPEESRLIMKVFGEYREQGWDTPQIVFYTNYNSGNEIGQIYEDIYKGGFMSSTWFRMGDKPVIIGKEEECSTEARDFFDIKRSQWPNFPIDENGWPWISFIRPQHVHRGQTGQPEVVSVSVAQHAQGFFGDSALYGDTGNWGRAYNHGRNDTDTDPDAWVKGGNATEQWEIARAADPRVVMFTGWNEWTNNIAWHPRSDYPLRPVNLVDQANQEYSRDIEMMRGGYFDNYYMQFIGDLRRYKGAPEYPCGEGNKTIEIDGSFEQWDDVHVEYNGFTCENMNRDSIGHSRMRYVNATGRNDFQSCKIAYNVDSIYFMVTTKDNATGFDGIGDWMRLYINTNALCAGYTHIVNYRPVDDVSTTLVVTGGQLDGAVIHRDIRYKVKGRKMMLEVPRKAIGIYKQPFTILFKWADSKVSFRNYEDFYENGDCMPIGRLCYGFSGGRL